MIRGFSFTLTDSVKRQPIEIKLVFSVYVYVHSIQIMLAQYSWHVTFHMLFGTHCDIVWNACEMLLKRQFFQFSQK